MTNAEWFAMIESTLEEVKGVSEAVRTIQTEDIPKLFQRTLEWESLDQWVKTLEANKGVEGSESSASL